MTKPAIARLFFGSLVAIIAGVLVLCLAALWAFGSGLVELEGLVGDPAVLVLALVVGAVAMLGGAIGQFVAWIGALVNTSHLDDKMWFVLLLVLGLFSFGFVAMLVYVLAGPDWLDSDQRRIAGPAGGAA